MQRPKEQEMKISKLSKDPTYTKSGPGRKKVNGPGKLGKRALDGTMYGPFRSKQGG
jgi:hypothetical protein